MSEQAVYKTGEALVVCIAPDVCRTPMGAAMVPVAYTITARFDAAELTADDVRYHSSSAFTMKSRIARVKGDEAGTGGGIISGVNLGGCRPIEHSDTVLAGGAAIVRDGDLMHMNYDAASGSGPANTYGRVTFVEVVDMGAIDLSALASGGGPALEGMEIRVPPGMKMTIFKGEPQITTDPETGRVTVKEYEVSRDGTTGNEITTQRSTFIDPETGEMEVKTLTFERDSRTGATTFEYQRGTFDPGIQQFELSEPVGGDVVSGRPPTLEDVIRGEASVTDIGRVPVGQMTQDGRMWLADGTLIDPMADPDELGLLADPELLRDPELMADPEYRAALEEYERERASFLEIDKELRWELTKAGIDAAGVVDPTPTMDGLSAVIALSEWDIKGAACSVISIIPWFGDALGKTAKGKKILDALNGLRKLWNLAKAKLFKASKRLKNAFRNARRRLGKRFRRAPKELPPAPSGRPQPRKKKKGGHVPKKPPPMINVKGKVVPDGKGGYKLNRKNIKNREKINGETDLKTDIGAANREAAAAEIAAERKDVTRVHMGDEAYKRQHGLDLDKPVPSGDRKSGVDVLAETESGRYALYEGKGNEVEKALVQFDKAGKNLGTTQIDSMTIMTREPFEINGGYFIDKTGYYYVRDGTLWAEGVQKMVHGKPINVIFTTQ